MQNDGTYQIAADGMTFANRVKKKKQCHSSALYLG